MIDERQQELASLYVFDLLEGEERTRFEATMAENAELRALVDELRVSASALAHTAPAANPPASLKQRVMASVGDKAVAGRESAEIIAFPFARLIPWAAAAGLAVSTLWLGERYLTTRAEAEALRQQQALADVALRSARAQVEAEHLLGNQAIAALTTLKADTDRQLTDAQKATTQAQEQLAIAVKRADDARAEVVALNERAARESDLARLKITTLTSMLKNSPEAVAVAVWDPREQRGVLNVDRLPANTENDRYELWVIDAKPVSAGVFEVPAGGKAQLQFTPASHIGGAKKFAVSREKNDGQRTHASPGEVIMISE